MSKECAEFCPAVMACNRVFAGALASQQQLQQEADNYQRTAESAPGQNAAPALASGIENISYGFAIKMRADIAWQIKGNDRRYLRANDLLVELEDDIAPRCRGPQTGIWGALVVRANAMRSRDPVETERFRYLTDHAKCGRRTDGRIAIRLANKI